jgi:hypothetical protein
MTPVGLAATTDPDVLYAGAGAFDRVAAYRLRPGDGLLRDRTPFSQTDEEKNAFPNDVAIAVLSDRCSE